MFTSGISGSSDSSSFNFLKSFHIYFHSDCTNLHSPPKCTRVPFSLHSCQHLLFLVFLIIAIVTGLRWYLTGVLICISLMIIDLVVHLYTFCGKCPLRFSAHFSSLLEDNCFTEFCCFLSNLNMSQP